MSQFLGAFEKIIANIDDNVSSKTALRAAKAFAYMTKGYEENLKDAVGDGIFPAKSIDEVVIKDIQFFSLCEHHLLPFFGTCNITYKPKQKVLGLSKFARIVEHFARRLQLQEKLTLLVATCIKEMIDAEYVTVTMKAKHLCMHARGVQQFNSEVETKYTAK